MTLLESTPLTPPLQGRGVTTHQILVADRRQVPTVPVGTGECRSHTRPTTGDTGPPTPADQLLGTRTPRVHPPPGFGPRRPTDPRSRGPTETSVSRGTSHRYGCRMSLPTRAPPGGWGGTGGLDTGVVCQTEPLVRGTQVAPLVPPNDTDGPVALTVTTPPAAADAEAPGKVVGAEFPLGSGRGRRRLDGRTVGPGVCESGRSRPVPGPSTLRIGSRGRPGPSGQSDLKGGVSGGRVGTGGEGVQLHLVYCLFYFCL